MKKILSILFLFVSFFAKAQNPAGSTHAGINFLKGRIKTDSIPALSLDTTAQKLFAMRLSDSLLVRVPWPTFGSGGGGTPGGNSKDVQIKSGPTFYGSDNFSYDTVNSRVGIGTATPLSPLYILNSSLGTTQNNNQGIWLANTTTGSQQISPSLTFEGNARFASVADSSFRYVMYALPTGGSSVVTGNFLIQPQVNGVNKNAVYINQNGQIGIGGMTPARELEARDSSGTNQLRLSVDGATHLDMGVGTTGIISLLSTGSFANNITLGSGSGNVQVFGNHGASSYACYGAQNVGTSQYALVLGNLGTYGATRNAYIYDFAASKGRTGWDVNGTMYVGSTNSAYTLSVAQPSSIAGTVVQDNISTIGFVGIGVSSPISQLEVGGSVKYNSTGSYGTTGALIGTTPHIQLRDNFTSLSGTQTHMVVNGFAIDSMGVQHSGITYTNASTIYIEGAPVSMATTASDTAVTITKPWAVYVKKDNSTFLGKLFVKDTTDRFSSFQVNGGIWQNKDSAITSAAGSVMSLGIDTATGRYVKFTAGGSTPTLQQVLTAGSTLTGANTVVTGGFNFAFSGTGHILLGTATDNGELTVAGVAAPEANITRDLGTSSFAWRDLYYSHTVSESAIGASSTLGTNVTSLTPAGSDEDFTLTLVTSGAVAGTIGNIAFGRTWVGGTPHCVISAANAVTGTAVFGGGGQYMALNATSTSNITFAAAITASGTYIFNCHCGL